MVAKIQKWGNSQGIRFPREALRQVHISIGDEVDILVEHGEIRLKPTHTIRGRYKIKDLVPAAKMGRRKEIEWGKPQGKEIW
jgi:antitoxin MazE